jgi:hypothetical protein
MSNPKQEQETVIACDLTVFTEEQREQHITLAGEIFAAVDKVGELADGYTFRLPGDSAMVFKLAEFIRDERLCCPFWTFGVTLEPPGGAIWLQLTGPDGAKQAVVAELVGLLDTEVAATAGLR